MPLPRLRASIEASGLIRRAQGEGGFGTVVRKGDPERGALLIVVRSRGAYVACLERMLALSGAYEWTKAGPGRDTAEAELADFLEKRRRFDEDSWIIELDIAQPERFIAETTGLG